MSRPEPPPSRPSLSGQDWSARIAHVRRSGPEALNVWVRLLGDPDWSFRRRVVAELAELGNAAVTALCEVLVNDRADEAKNAATVDALAASVGDVGPALLALTEHPTAAVVADAVQILGRRREARAVPILSKLAAGYDDNVAVAAIEALGRIGGRGAVEVLISLVRGGNFFRTFPAIDVLGRSGDPRAIGPLAALLQDARYALEAMRALSRTVDRHVVAPLAAMLVHTSPLYVRTAAVSLAELAQAYGERYGDNYIIGATLAQAAAPGSLRSLSAALHGADNQQGGAIARVLGMLRNPAAVDLLSSLLDEPSPVGSSAVLALEALGSEVTDQLRTLLLQGDSARRAMLMPLVSREMNAVSEVTACLSDPDGQVRAQAALALARIAAVEAVPSLFALLGDPNPRVTQAATTAIQALGSSETERLTLAAAASPDVRIKREALRLVRCFGYASALPIVLPLLDSPDERLREAATLALSLIEDPNAEQALILQAGSKDEKTRAMATRALGQAAKTPASVYTLLKATADVDSWVRYYAAQALGRLRLTEGLPALCGLLNDPATQVRVSAVEALSHLPSPEAFSALETAAQSEEPDLRRAAVLGLGTLERAEALPILIAALKSEDPATRLVAVSALGAFDSLPAIDALGHAANDDDESVSTTAVGLLAQKYSREATLALIRLLPQHRNVDRVRLALAASYPGRVEGVELALREADDETAAILASALARMRTSESLDALIASLQSNNVAARKAVAMALGALGGERVRESLHESTRTDPDPEVRRISALGSAQT
jgi:HEAT repeat protein